MSDCDSDLPIPDATMNEADAEVSTIEHIELHTVWEIPVEPGMLWAASATTEQGDILLCSPPAEKPPESVQFWLIDRDDGTIHRSSTHRETRPFPIATELRHSFGPEFFIDHASERYAYLAIGDYSERWSAEGWDYGSVLLDLETSRLVPAKRPWKFFKRDAHLGSLVQDWDSESVLLRDTNTLEPRFSLEDLKSAPIENIEVVDRFFIQIEHIGYKDVDVKPWSKPYGILKVIDMETSRTVLEQRFDAEVGTKHPALAPDRAPTERWFWLDCGGDLVGIQVTSRGPQRITIPLRESDFAWILEDPRSIAFTGNYLVLLTSYVINVLPSGPNVNQGIDYDLTVWEANHLVVCKGGQTYLFEHFEHMPPDQFRSEGYYVAEIHNTTGEIRRREVLDAVDCFSSFARTYADECLGPVETTLVLHQNRRIGELIVWDILTGRHKVLMSNPNVLIIWSSEPNYPFLGEGVKHQWLIADPERRTLRLEELVVGYPGCS